MARIVLVTGGAGHVGSHVIEGLVKDSNNKVISLDNYFNGDRSNHIVGAEYRRGHTKNIDTIVPEKPDTIYHLGEYARTTPSFDEVGRVYDMNIVGTFSVVEYCRKNKSKLVYAASSTKFAIEGDGRHQSPYALTKAVNVDLINDYAKWYGLNYAICYFYNAYGPREKGTGKYATVIAKFIDQYAHGKPMTITRPGTQRRNYTYVKDLANGIILVGDKGSGDGYSLNSTESYSVKDIADAIGGKVVYADGSPGRMETGDIPDRARKELGWDTTTNVIDYIKKTVKHHTASQ